MPSECKIDTIDIAIIQALQKDARTPYTDIAARLGIASGTVHQRMNKMWEAGVIKGSTLLVDYQKLGYDVEVLLGIHLRDSKDIENVIAALRQLPEVIEIDYTTGNYALFVRVMCRSNQDFYHFLAGRLQRIKGIQSTESFVSLHQPLKRERPLDS